MNATTNMNVAVNINHYIHNVNLQKTLHAPI